MSVNYFLKMAFVAMFISSCSTVNPVMNSDASDLKEVVKDSETTFVDVRIPEEFQEKTVKDAVNIPLATIEDNIEFFKKQKKVVLFCNRGIQSQKALDILKKNGVENVYTGKTINNVIAIQNEK